MLGMVGGRRWVSCAIACLAMATNYLPRSLPSAACYGWRRPAAAQAHRAAHNQLASETRTRAPYGKLCRCLPIVALCIEVPLVGFRRDFRKWLPEMMSSSIFRLEVIAPTACECDVVRSRSRYLAASCVFGEWARNDALLGMCTCPPLIYRGVRLHIFC